MTLDEAFGTGNVSVLTVGGVTKVSLRLSAFPEISVAESNALTGDIRRIAYGIAKQLGISVRSIQSRDTTQTSASAIERYENLYEGDDVAYEATMTFAVQAEVLDVKDEAQ